MTKRSNWVSVLFSIFMIILHFSIFLPLAFADSLVISQEDPEGLSPPQKNTALLKPRYVEGELVIKLKDNNSLNSIRNRPGVLSVNPVFKHLSFLSGKEKSSAVDRGLDRVYLVTFDKKVSIDNMLKEYKDDPLVEYFQPNYIYEPDLIPNDPRYSEQYAHQLTQAEAAWDISTGSSDVVIAVIGTGVDIDHPDLTANTWTNVDEIPGNNVDDDGNGYIDDVYGWNFYNDNNNPRPSGSSHETMVAGIIAAVGNNSQGICGVTWKSVIMPLRVAYTSADVADAVEYARVNSAHIINMSFGNYDKTKYGDYLVKEMLDDAYEAGILLVATAGNDKSDWKRYPAALYNVMAVAATDQSDHSSSWGYSGTNYGLWVDIAAPGSGILSTIPGGGYSDGDGTSFAAPYVAGLGALLFSHQPSLTNLQAKSVLENTTNPVDIINNYFYVGTGRVNAGQALSTSSTDYPIGEIAAPEYKTLISMNTQPIPLTLLAHGDHYQIEYSPFGSNQWTLIAQGDPNADTQADGLIHLFFDNPGLGAYILRLTVTTGSYTHRDSKMFGIEGDYQENWPYDTPGNRYIGASPICMDIDEDGNNEIIQSTQAYYTYIWNEDGTNVPGWPQHVQDVPSNSSSAVGDVDGDGDYEVVTTTYSSGLVYAWHWQDGKLLSGHWPKALGYLVRANPLLADLDGDGDAEIIIAHDGVHVFQHDGTLLWYYEIWNTQAPMAAADLDGDGDIEIIVQAISSIHVLDHEGNQVAQWSGGSHPPPVIADLDKDGELEIINVSGSVLNARHLIGSPLWQRNLGLFGGYGATSVGDLDEDGYFEVFVVDYIGSQANNKIYAVNHDGTPLSALDFPRDLLGKGMQNAPTVGDINGDGKKDLVVSSSSGLLFAWDRNGDNLDTFPRLVGDDGIYTTATLVDLDQDGDIEIMMGDTGGRFYVWDLPGTYNPDNIDWGMYRHDPQCSGLALRAPKLNPINIPTTIHLGQTLQFQMTAANPDNLPLHFYVRQMPIGASFDPQTGIFTWTPTADQVGNTYKFYLFLTDGIRQDHRPVWITVLEEAAITVTAPNGGETWQASSSHTVTWTSSNLTDNVTIDLYKGGTYHSYIGTTTVGAGSRQWDIPPDIPAGNDYRVRIHQDGIEDYSDSDFSIIYLDPFRSSPDFNGDGYADVIWRYYGPGGYNAIWLIGTTGADGTAATTTRSLSNTNKIKPDFMNFARQGKDSQKNVWESFASQEIMVIKDGFSGVKSGDKPSFAFPNLSRVMAASVSDPRDDPQSVDLMAVADLDWHLSGTGDFNFDGKIDIVWSHSGDGRNCVWYLDGVTFSGYAAFPQGSNPDWKLSGVEDFNLDGKPDLLWRNEVDGRNAVWYMDGTTLLNIGIMTAGANLDWKLCGTGDFNNDGKADLVWRNLVDGRNAVWYMDGAELVSVGWLTPVEDQNWKLRGTGDFNNDGKTDLVWTNIADGRNCIWYLDGVTLTGVEFLTTVTNTTWKIEN
ncbi:MAG: S8 family serine peptidase [Candidatus Aminicenantes bacterium]|jgi:subtilisin family serine protease